MTTQPEYQRLIQHMDDEWPEDWDGNAIRAELRRLHALNQELVGALIPFAKVDLRTQGIHHRFRAQVFTARAAIAKAEETK